LPAALFQLSEAELAAEQAARKQRFEFGRWDDGEDVLSAEQTREASDDGNKWTENVQTESASATAD
jgi:hypothetical protein